MCLIALIVLLGSGFYGSSWCKRCDGTGIYNRCGSCSGSGVVNCTNCNATGKIQSSSDCPDC